MFVDPQSRAGQRETENRVNLMRKSTEWEQNCRERQFCSCRRRARLLGCAFDLRGELFFRNVGEAHDLHLLIGRHSSAFGSLALRELTIGGDSILAMLIAPLRLELLQQLAASHDSTSANAQRQLLKLVVVGLLCVARESRRLVCPSLAFIEIGDTCERAPVLQFMLRRAAANG